MTGICSESRERSKKMSFVGKTSAEEWDRNSFCRLHALIAQIFAVLAIAAQYPLRLYGHSQLCCSQMGGAIKGNEPHSTFLYCFLGSRA